MCPVCGECIQKDGREARECRKRNALGLGGEGAAKCDLCASGDYSMPPLGWCYAPCPHLRDRTKTVTLDAKGKKPTPTIWDDDPVAAKKESARAERAQKDLLGRRILVSPQYERTPPRRLAICRMHAFNLSAISRMPACNPRMQMPVTAVSTLQLPCKSVPFSHETPQNSPPMLGMPLTESGFSTLLLSAS